MSVVADFVLLIIVTEGVGESRDERRHFMGVIYLANRYTKPAYIRIHMYVYVYHADDSKPPPLEHSRRKGIELLRFEWAAS